MRPPPSQLAAALRARVKGRVLERAPLAPFTTFRVGGPADVLVEAECDEDLVAVAEVVGPEVALAVVGRGSNLLVSDEGFRGVAVRLGRGYRTHRRVGGGMELGGAVYLPAAARHCAQAGLAGLEFAAEIPATFGGAVAMNAGAHGRCVADVLKWAELVDLRSGARRRVGVDGLGYGYRRSAVRPEEVVVRGAVRLVPGDPAALAAQIREHVAWRRSHQPPGRSAGSVFKNPQGDSAGRLIEAAGLKGVRVGGAEVSPVHANFIVTAPGARAADVWELLWLVRRVVAQRMGVELEPEVRFLGAFPQARQT